MSAQIGSLAERVERGEFPATARDRFLGKWDSIWFMSAYGVATWNYLLGGWIASYLGFWPSVGALLLVVPAMLVASAAIVPHVRYGLSQFVGMRAWLGTHGVWVGLGLFALVAWGWVAILVVMAAHATNEVLGATGLPVLPWRALAILFAVVSVALAWKGSLYLKWLTRIAVPVIALVTVSILVLFFTRIGFESIAAAEPAFATGTRFDTAVGAGLGISWIGWYIWLGQVGRSCAREGSAVVGIWFGIGVLTAVTGVAGVVSALYVGDPDPTTWLLPLAGFSWGLMSLVFIIFANVTSGAVAMYAWAEAVKALMPRVNWAHPMAFVLAGTILLALFPWVFDAFDGFSAAVYLFTTPLVMIALVDFFVLKRGRLKVRQCYRAEDYGFWNGFNWVALAVWGVSTGIGMLIYNPVTYETTLMIGGEPLYHYTTDVIPVGVISAAAYYVIGKYYLTRRFPEAYGRDHGPADAGGRAGQDPSREEEIDRRHALIEAEQREGSIPKGSRRAYVLLGVVNAAAVVVGVVLLRM